MGRITTNKNMIWLGKNPRCIDSTEEYQPFWYSTAGNMEICAIVVACSHERAIEMIDQQLQEWTYINKSQDGMPRSEWIWEPIGEPNDTTERIIILAYGEF